MTYEETLSYLYEQLPMFTRIGAAAYKKDLTNTLALCEVLGNPQHKLKYIHIAGTNGKGSTTHMLAAVLQAAGYKTGLYTSPHLKDFRERIRINGVTIPKEYVVAFVERYKSDFERIQPSFFEWTVALCFDYFASEHIDVAVVETGLGGRLDSTNVISPLLSIITNIGLDHTDMLGDTHAKIAVEKAGIIKPNIPVVIGEYRDDTLPVFSAKSNETQSKTILAQEHLHLTDFTLHSNGTATCDVWEQDECILPQLNLELGGIYQQKNILTVIASIQQLNEMGFRISEQHIRSGVSHTIRLTGLLGRWQVLNKSPLTVCDTGHNEDGIKQLITQLEMQPFKKLHMVIGMVKDKDISKILQLLPQYATYYFCNAQLPRALPANELAETAHQFGLKGNAFNSVKEAYIAAQNSAASDDMVFIGGSTFVVAEVI